MNILSCNPWTSHKWEMVFIENIISACQLLHLLEGAETWKISLLPAPFYLFLVNMPFKGHLLVWMSSKQGPAFIPCCLPWCSYNPKLASVPIAVITINGLKWLTTSWMEKVCTQFQLLFAVWALLNEFARILHLLTEFCDVLGPSFCFWIALSSHWQILSVTLV